MDTLMRLPETTGTKPNGVRRLFGLLVISLLYLSDSSRGFAAEPSTSDREDGWPAYGHSFDQNHYSPLDDINVSNVSRLGLAWSFDIPGTVLATSEPLESGGVLYFAVGYSVVRALNARTGELLWEYDPKVAGVAGVTLRGGWGIRGLAYANERVFVGTHDGRLIGLDAKTGKPVWTADTFPKGEMRFISGPPLVFGDKVLIGNAGTEFATLRGYVTAYDAKTGRQAWRFYTVPGNPAKGFENDAMKMAAKTWTGQWWRFGGGGGCVWNAMSYDPELHRVYIGTSNGSPWNEKIRSPKGGDNLFIASIVALDAETGAYVWHYQANPGESWDFDATTDIELARIVIDGKPRRVLLQASKNGFFYVIDRETGKLISAEPFVKVTWAERIDLTTGRPVEVPNSRYQSGPIMIFPGPVGAHAAQAMAYSPSSALAYIPALGLPGNYDDTKIDLKNWQEKHDAIPNVGITLAYGDLPVSTGGSSLLAWDPIRQKAAWQVNVPGSSNAGIAATAGQLVFQGRADGKLVAYDANDGNALWSFDAQVGIVGAPILFKSGGREYLTVVAGFGSVPAMLGSSSSQFGWDARTQKRRVLTFALDGAAHLPPAPPTYKFVAVDDPTFVPNPTAEKSGEIGFSGRCFTCHGGAAIAGGMAPDLRASPLILSSDGFRAVVQGGALLNNGMPQFEEMAPAELENIRQYLRKRAHETHAQ
jgi:quinohemoprotein ethanol dehydrogenase